jgi:putative tryptophan/tyrosine transport system substrate-binding protein
MDRRTFLAGTGTVLLATPPAAEGQQARKIYRIGMLLALSPEHPQTRELSGAFREGLRKLGYVEGQNIAIESRSAQGRFERLPNLLAELVRLNVDLLYSGGTPAALAAKQANITIPVVAPAVGDPVSDGLIASLAQPGGHITGSSFLGPGLVSKRLAGC